MILFRSIDLRRSIGSLLVKPLIIKAGNTSKNLWYAVEFCNAIGTSPKLLKILDRELVWDRTADGRIQAIDNTCVHRGVALATGWSENDCIDCIVCPDRGWITQFDIFISLFAIRTTYHLDGTRPDRST